MRGKVKMIGKTGFGFIGVEGEEKDIFFHATALKGVEFDQLQVGTMVTFNVVEGERGLKASSVELEV